MINKVILYEASKIRDLQEYYSKSLVKLSFEYQELYFREENITNKQLIKNK